MNSTRAALIALAFFTYVLIKVIQTKDANPFIDIRTKPSVFPVAESDVWSREDGHSDENNTDVKPVRDEEYERRMNETDNQPSLAPNSFQETRTDAPSTIDIIGSEEEPGVVTRPPAGIDDDDVRFWEENRIPNFYNDKFETYDCKRKYAVAGSNPKFMVIGVHKGGSTGLYNYLAKHGRIRPAVCKEIHFFDMDIEYAKGKYYYLRNFPDVTFWRNRVITGEGSPDYIRIPKVAQRVKDMFPDTKFILTLREPSTRFVSHWVGKKDQLLGPFATMTCEEAWNSSLAQYEKCTATGIPEFCETKLHENALVRGIYVSQIATWLKYFPTRQFLIIQAESMFINRTKILQQSTAFLRIRPYNEEELVSLTSANTGSAHHDEPLAKDCDHLMDRMRDFYAEPNRRLQKLLKEKFPLYTENWVDGWSGMENL